MFVLALMSVCLFGRTAAGNTNMAGWLEGQIGDWMSTNWVTPNGLALPPPGYPGNDYDVEVWAGNVTSASQDVSVASLQLQNTGTLLNITNSHSLTVRNTLNSMPSRYGMPSLNIADGTVNVLNTFTGTVRDLSVQVGGFSGDGYLDLGAVWGATNAYPSEFGTLANVLVSLTNGGFRVDASNITMQTTCTVYNAGQEMTFRGDWLNTDGTTTFMVNGKGTGTIDIAGNFSFGGCKLYTSIDTNGINLIQVGGDAILTNAILTVGCTDTLTNPAATYDLIRVPTAKTIYTNGMSFNIASNGGFAYTTAVETNRSGFDYLVITPGLYLPSVTITNPVDESFFTAVTNIPLQATASARSGTITKVEFYADAVKVGEATNAPYAVTWTNVYAGYYEVKAIATDSNGKSGLSPSLGLNVQGTKADGRKVFITGGAVITYDPGCAQ